MPGPLPGAAGELPRLLFPVVLPVPPAGAVGAAGLGGAAGAAGFVWPAPGANARPDVIKFAIPNTGAAASEIPVRLNRPAKSPPLQPNTPPNRPSPWVSTG